MRHYRVAVIGAGISGICAAIYLRRAGIDDFILFEKASDVGGTWRDNRYPGVECDVPSHLYSYSFELKPDWSREYPPGSEIHQYLRDVVAKYDIGRHLCCDTAIVRGDFSDGCWTLHSSAGETWTADVLVSAMGGLHTPNIPNFPGLADFSGPCFHTARWRDDVDLSGKQVVMIGTGATAVQCGPKLAEIADKLTVFQRTPVWVGPKKNPQIAPEEIALLSRDRDALRAKRWELWRGWETTSLEMVTEGSRINRKGEQLARDNIAQSVADPDLRAALTPDYNYTCKRPTISNVYYAMFERDNVDLITSGVARIEPDAVVADNGERVRADAIVLATGFKSFDITNEIDLRNADGRSLKDIWAGQITNYRSVMAPDMPNLFFLLGPNTAGLTSSYQMIEPAAGWIVRMIEHMDRHGVREVRPRQTEIDLFRDDILRRFRTTTQNKGCTSWWTDDSGYPHANWPGSSISYRQMMTQLEPRHFDFA